MRLFVAAWPPPAVIEVLAALDGPDEGLRWTGAEQRHVTLRFLGNLDEVDGAEVARRVERLQAPACTARLGPATRRLGRSALVVPVAGLDELARAVASATAGLGQPDDRPFRGHLTLARARGRRGAVPTALAGTPVSAAWRVGDVALVRSHLGSAGARYETLATAGLA